MRTPRKEAHAHFSLARSFVPLISGLKGTIVPVSPASLDYCLLTILQAQPAADGVSHGFCSFSRITHCHAILFMAGLCSLEGHRTEQKGSGGQLPAVRWLPGKPSNADYGGDTIGMASHPDVLGGDNNAPGGILYLYRRILAGSGSPRGPRAEFCPDGKMSFST